MESDPEPARSYAQWGVPIRQGTGQLVPAEQVQTGYIILLKPGGGIPAGRGKTARHHGAGRTAGDAMFNNFPEQRVVMNLKKGCILILIIVGLVAFSGCFTMTGPTPQNTLMTPEPVTPHATTTPMTPLPVSEIARIQVDHFGMNPSTGTVYEFLGTLQVNKGPFQSVQVILRYPDIQEYAYDLGGMGGANETVKPFYLYPADRYKGTNPEKIIVLDGKQYGTVYRYEDGVTVWIATTDKLLNT